MRPTHRHKPTGSLVFPRGYPKASLELLEPDFWEKEDERVRLEELRLRRNQLLRDSDHMVLPDRGLSPERYEKWVQYRQALRDLPTSSGSDFPRPPD